MDSIGMSLNNQKGPDASMLQLHVLEEALANLTAAIVWSKIMRFFSGCTDWCTPILCSFTCDYYKWLILAYSVGVRRVNYTKSYARHGTVRGMSFVLSIIYRLDASQLNSRQVSVLTRKLLGCSNILLIPGHNQPRRLHCASYLCHHTSRRTSCHRGRTRVCRNFASPVDGPLTGWHSWATSQCLGAW